MNKQINLSSLNDELAQARTKKKNFWIGWKPLYFDAFNEGMSWMAPLCGAALNDLKQFSDGTISISSAFMMRLCRANKK